MEIELTWQDEAKVRKQVLWGVAVNKICNPTVDTLIHEAKKAAQQSVQLTALRRGWRARLGNWLVSLGNRIAQSGGN